MRGCRLGVRASRSADSTSVELTYLSAIAQTQERYLTQVAIPITTADFYFPLESRPLIAFVDGRVHHKTNQMMKDEELRTLLRKRGYRILELLYDFHTDKKRDQFYNAILDDLRRNDKAI